MFVKINYFNFNLFVVSTMMKLILLNNFKLIFQSFYRVVFQ